MPSGGALTLHAENCNLRKGDGILPPDFDPGAFVRIRVEDTGTGIPKKIQDRIYDPFFTTKPFGEGTGLGLSTTLGIIQSHGGFIHLRSREREGTTFTIYLPSALRSNIPTKRIHQVPVSKSADSQSTIHKNILVVDDETSIRILLQKTLEKLGYNSIAASNGAEAVSIFVEQHSQIDLTITDLMMPIMDGNALIKTFKKMDPEHKIIAVSGVGSETTLTDETRALVNAFISKPFDQASLEKELQRVIGA